jgi:hypothetical protein
VRWYRKTFPDGDWKLFQGPADVYMVCLTIFSLPFAQLIEYPQQFSLFVFDFLQAMGGALDVQWAHNGIVTTGHYCTAQGIIQQIGEVGVALITLVRLPFIRYVFRTETHRCAFRQFLAVHTFVAALWQVGLHARGVAFGMVCLACVFITLWVAIGMGIHSDYETPTPVR